MLKLIYILGFINLYPNPKIEVSAIKTSISEGNDSIYIQGLDNRLRIEIPGEEKAEFEYHLKGFDTQTYHSEFPVVAYTNIPGGQYNFRYRFNQESWRTISVEVMEAFWQKWWFWPVLFLYVLLLVGVGLFLFFQYNFRQKLKVEHLRNKIAADLHDEVGSNLSSIAIYTQVLRKKLGKAQPELDQILNKITDNSKESVNLMQDTVWTLNPTNDDTEHLIHRLGSFARELLAAQNVSYSEHIEIDLQKIKLDMERRKNLYLILKEAVNNAAKYADASKVVLRVMEQKSRVTFEISDDGVGFNQAEVNEGNGLHNYYKRAEESDFEVNVQSENNIGTKISVTI
ncbi:sensor histidine kinase [Jiulongibacter sp. NS-SX5]|uniref:sensor histidine kinase n=1 Tax=Jiulongibacter sp. NS-SX5 TaxID=3463854 RepID=UPI00405816DE